MPRFGHLPMVLGEGHQRLSKRKTPEASLVRMRTEGFLPEGILNYLALLGWSMGGDRELFTLDEMVAAFARREDQPQPGHVRREEAHRRSTGSRSGTSTRPSSSSGCCRSWSGAGLLASPVSDAQLELVAAAAPLVQERSATLVEAATLLELPARARPPLRASTRRAGGEGADAVGRAGARRGRVRCWPSCQPWTVEDVQEALQAALVDGLGLKPRVAYGPVRVAVTGRTVSPPLFESIELLGRERTLARLRAARAGLGSAPAHGLTSTAGAPDRLGASDWGMG